MQTHNFHMKKKRKVKNIEKPIQNPNLKNENWQNLMNHK
jgi:hypothetical protein